MYIDTDGPKFGNSRIFAPQSWNYAHATIQEAQTSQGA
jgi:hypothetical protein